MNSNLYPVVEKCDGTCGKQHPLNKMMRRWYQPSEAKGLHVKWHTYKRDHYCMPCWNDKVEEDKNDTKL